MSFLTKKATSVLLPPASVCEAVIFTLPSAPVKGSVAAKLRWYKPLYNCEKLEKTTSIPDSQSPWTTTLFFVGAPLAGVRIVNLGPSLSRMNVQGCS